MTDAKKEDFSRILVGVDDSDDALLAFHYAIHRAAATGAELIIVSVLENDDNNIYEQLSKDYIHGKREDLVEHVKKYEETAKKGNVQHVESIVAEGDAGEAIVKNVIPHVEPDLLIIGSKSKLTLSHHFGSQAAYMARYAPISVMVIR